MAALYDKIRKIVKYTVWATRSANEKPRYHWLYFVLFYTACVNIPYWIACHEIGLLHFGLFCTEYMLVGVLALFAPPVLASTTLLLVMFFDFLSGICQTYQISITECFENIGVYHSISIRRQIAVIVCVILMLMVAGSSAFAPAFTVSKERRLRVVACLIAFTVIFLSVDSVRLYSATGHVPNPFRSAPKMLDKFGMNRYSPLRLARIPVVRVGRILLSEVELHSMIQEAGQSSHFVESATGKALHLAELSQYAEKEDKPNVVLILVESWGLSNNASIRDALIRPYLQPGLMRKYKAVQGTVPFYGSTVAGEARELCKSSIGLHLMDASSTELNGCLPNKMTALEYSNVAVHGMNGEMFERSTWWKTAGFRELWFNDQFKEQGLPDCLGAFRGTCDSSIAEWIGKRLENKSEDPNFVYWVTLNSHLPVLVPSPITSGTPCDAAISLSPNTSLCSWFKLVANVHQSVGQLAMGQMARPTIFVVVGDHAPPFADKDIASQFSSTVVPYIILLPRTTTSQCQKPIR